jgi:excisionase family DNA binding protein
MPDWISTAEAAQWLHVNRITVIRAIHDGKLPAFRVGKQFRIEWSAVEAFAKPVSGSPQ